MAIRTVTYTKDKQLSPHFKLSDFKCKESNIIKYSDELIALLEKIFTTCKNISDKKVENGYRTPDYSVKVGGSRNDGHTVGIAIDIIFYDNANKIISPKVMACICQDLGFTGIGIMKDSIHLDVRTTANYKNGKWWGDETNGKDDIKDFYAYTGLTRAYVNNALGIEDKITITYQVYDSKWLPNVKNNEDYAGRYGRSICAVLANLSKGDITYRVHIPNDKNKKQRARWLPAVKNREDYAGILDTSIDGLMMKTNTKKTIHYQVHIKGGSWLDYVTGYNEKDSNNGYAGILGKDIDAIRCYIK